MGITNHPPLRIKPAFKTAKTFAPNTQTAHKQDIQTHTQVTNQSGYTTTFTSNCATKDISDGSRTIFSAPRLGCRQHRRTDFIGNCNPHLATHSHSNSPATSMILCHTSQLCAREVGITNRPPLRTTLALRTTKKCISTKHKQHLSNSEDSQHDTNLRIASPNLGTCGLWAHHTSAVPL